MPITYKESGVDLDLYQQSMQRLPGMMRGTSTPRVMELAGGFAGLFRLQGDGHRYEDPVLVSGTDGVGTKLKVAILGNTYTTVGIDLVAMCVNDCLCLGAEPLFFLDYLAIGKDDPALVADLVQGVADGCKMGGMALLGGETAVMPDLYREGEFDMAGFCVGVVERERLVDGSRIQPGDKIIGLASNGFHSNGFSLLRKCVFEAAGLSVSDAIPGLNRTVGEAILEPTRIYVETVQAVLQGEHGSAVHGMAHITGGGLQENVDRVLPEGCRAEINRDSWTAPPVYDWLTSLGHIEPEEMHRVFNMGIGYTLIADAASADSLIKACDAKSQPAWVIGEIVGS